MWVATVLVNVPDCFQDHVPKSIRVHNILSVGVVSLVSALVSCVKEPPHAPTIITEGTERTDL